MPKTDPVELLVPRFGFETSEFVRCCRELLSLGLGASITVSASDGFDWPAFVAVVTARTDRRGFATVEMFASHRFKIKFFPKENTTRIKITHVHS